MSKKIPVVPFEALKGEDFRRVVTIMSGCPLLAIDVSTHDFHMHVRSEVEDDTTVVELSTLATSGARIERLAAQEPSDLLPETVEAGETEIALSSCLIRQCAPGFELQIESGTFISLGLIIAVDRKKNKVTVETAAPQEFTSGSSVKVITLGQIELIIPGTITADLAEGVHGYDLKHIIPAVPDPIHKFRMKGTIHFEEVNTRV